MDFDLTSVLRGVAPTLASAFGSPAAGLAVNAILDAVLPADEATKVKQSGDKTKEAILKDIVQDMSPEIQAKLRKLDNDFKAKMKALENETLRIKEDGIADARKREIALGDKTVSNIGYSVLAIWLLLNLLTFYMIFNGTQFTSTEVSIVSRVLGTLDMAVAAVVHYFLGSSEGSRRKDK